MVMATAALVEEQLLNSIATSEEDGEFEEDDELAANQLVANADSFAANNQLHNGVSAEDEALDEEEEADAEDEEMLSDEDAEGEADEEMISPPRSDGEEGSEEEGLSEDEDGEGVGAVKIQPKQLSDDEEVVSPSEDEDDDSVVDIEDDDDDASDTEEKEAPWEAVPDELDEEEPDSGNGNLCIFCQLDEDNDPSPDFEEYLQCGHCCDRAHNQCALSVEARKDGAGNWYCPNCIENKLVQVVPPTLLPKALEVEDAQEPEPRRISRDRIAGELLPSQRAIKLDSHSVFSELIAPDDPLDGTRLLRKRKAPGDEVEQAVDTPRARRGARDKDKTSTTNGVTVEGNGLHQSSLKTEPTLTNGNIDKTEIPASPRASRSLRPKVIPPVAPARIFARSARSITMAFRIRPEELQHVLSFPPNPNKKRSSTLATGSSTAVSAYMPISYAQPFYSLHDREIDELKSKPYGGILSEEEAKTDKTLPEPQHRRQFDEARQKAEEEWKSRVAAQAELAVKSGIKKARKVSGPASQIEYIEFGQYQIDIWYAAPYPEEYSRNKALFICEFCLKYMESDIVAWRHKLKCPWKHPPGDEIYRDGKVMIFEVDGRKNPLYCQNLCLLAKLFLGSKTLYYDVEPFLFYVMTEFDELGCHFVGYFSKEKRPSSQNNVSCILVLPIHQRKGYGHLLIDFSYLLTRVERKTGSPEKPLSDMGLVSYRNYWRLVLCYYLKDFKPGDRVPSVKRISDDMGLTPDDVISALDAQGALIRDPQTGTYAFKLTTDYYLEVIRQHESKGYAKLNPKALVWTPYIMGRGNASTFDHAPPLNTVAPREDDDEEMTGHSVNRTFEMSNGLTNGDTDGVIDSMGRLSTGLDDSINVAMSEGSHDHKSNGSSNNSVASYYEAAASIPPTRFEVFPPPPGSKNRGTPRASRPTPSRPKSHSASRPSSRRPSLGTSARRSTPSRPSARRKSGGTGRGPGRWPKGTTKKDFGNADSGPGLPPKILKQRSRLGNEILLGDEDLEDNYNEDALQDEDEEEEDGDAIVFETPGVRKRRDLARGLGKPASAGLGKPSPGKNGLGKPHSELLGRRRLATISDDLLMEDEISGDLDIDAEGDDE